MPAIPFFTKGLVPERDNEGVCAFHRTCKDIALLGVFRNWFKQFLKDIGPITYKT